MTETISHCTYPRRNVQTNWAWVAWINTGIDPPKVVTNPNTNQARCSTTSLKWRTPLPNQPPISSWLCMSLLSCSRQSACSTNHSIILRSFTVSGPVSWNLFPVSVHSHPVTRQFLKSARSLPCSGRFQTLKREPGRLRASWKSNMGRDLQNMGLGWEAAEAVSTDREFTGDLVWWPIDLGASAWIKSSLVTVGSIA